MQTWGMKKTTGQDLQHCPKCRTRLKDAFLLAAGGAAMARRRPPESRKGPPKVLKPCPFCRLKFGVAELRSHKPRCTKRPA